MKFWQALSFSEPEQLIELAKTAEEVGFDGVLLSDHLFLPEALASGYPYSPDGAPPFAPETPFPDPWVTIGAMVAATERLLFSTIVFILPLRNPLEVAKSTATLAVLSGNRFALGVGAGWMKEEFDQLGVVFKTRGKRYDEMIEVLRKLWGGGMVEHHGSFFDFDRLQMSPAPSAPIPIYTGGASARALRRAAELADGWIGPGNDPAEVPALLARMRTLRESAGRGDLPFEAMVPLTTPPEVDTLKRLQEAGMTSAVSYPPMYALGPVSSLADKRAMMESYAEQIIGHMR